MTTTCNYVTRGKRRKAAQTGGGAQRKILAFILDFATAKAIRESLELPAQEPAT